MDCPSCGSQCAAGARFCWSCGQPLRAPTEERRVVTVLFADLVGFTALSEHLDPEQVKRLVDHAFERLVRDVTAFGGRVDKIVGDAIVALFGAPVAHEDDAERAVRAALRMQETLATYATESGAGIRMRIGVNTGEVLVGALRAGGDYTAMGDVVNTASRLQTLAEPGEVLVGEATQLATRAVISYESRGALVPRGREHPINVWTALAAVQPPGYRPRQRETPLIGRDREMDSITDALRVSVGRGRGQMVLILGEAGVGKTRLANEVADVAALEHGLTHFSGRCVPYGEANPWWPVAEALRAGCGVRRDDPLEVARERTATAVARVCTPPTPLRADLLEHLAEHDLAAADPEDGGGPRDVGADDADGGDEARAAVVNGLLHLMGYDGPLRGLDGPAARTAATEALLTFLEASVRQGPIMIRLADLHWADQAVLDLLDEVSVQLARLPFLFVGTARRALQDRWSPRIGRFNTMVINLDPLDRGSSALLLDTLAGGDLDHRTRATLLDRSGGNPFYLEELVTLVGQQSADGEPAEVSSGEALPDTLRGLVAARIDGLTVEEQQVLEDAAVWGSSGPIEVLHRIAAAMRDVDDVTPVVQSMADKDVMVFDGADWSFRSDLIREVAYARLTKHERLVRHRGIAEYMERKSNGHTIDDGTTDTIARHYVVAARLDRDLGGRPGSTERIVEHAVRWALEAARRAEDDGAWLLARRLYTQALDLLDEDALADRYRCLVGRARVRAEAWDEQGSRRDAAEALELADALGDPGLRAHALLRMATAAARSGELTQADGELAEAIEIFDGVGDSRGRAEALRQRGLAELLRGDSRAAEEPIAAALDAFRAIGDRRGEAWSLQNLAWIALSDGRLDAADSFIAASERAFREVGDPGGLAWAQGLMAFTRLQQGDLDAAASIAGRILRECERRGDRFGEGMMLTVQAHVELWRGHTTAAATSASQAVAAFRTSTELSSTVGPEQALAVAGRAEIMAGNVGKGRHLLAEAIRSGHGGSGIGEFAMGVALVTGVQIGRPERLLDVTAERWIGAAGSGRSAAQEAVFALALAQAGRTDEAVPLARTAMEGEPDGGYVLSCGALVLAAAGLTDEARAAADRVLALGRTTYLDRIWAHIAVALVEPGPDGEQALARAEAELGLGEDVVAVAVVGLARLVCQARSEGRLADLDELRVERSDVGRALADLGLSDTCWSDLFVAAAGAVPVPS
ncbi:adenylate/guanylate cyclase domain-containing protein [Dermatobacter hominis]|uniref:adenylate/guanylate cyclase domain-containing protein n=1 Tax=Dermatobacter hominis TaxID=2884263 RepID=UPI001D11832E|nr:adenylate/guanylate cyclase domain-containing protein [Dermatobacter hominis]UDY34635.1 AAA family ATPase [Dermatobacter hominis]